MQVAHSAVRSIELAGHPFKTNFSQTLLRMQLTVKMRDPDASPSKTFVCAVHKSQPDITKVRKQLFWIPFPQSTRPAKQHRRG